MSIHISYNFSGKVHTAARIALDGVSGASRIGGHALQVRGSIELSLGTTITVADLGGHVDGLGEFERFRLNRGHTHQPFTLAIGLSRDQLRALESLRRESSELALRARFEVLAYGPFGIERLSAPGSIRLGGSEWHRALTDMNFADSVAFDVTVPKGSTPAEFEDARAAFERACARWRSADYHGVVGACREVLEALGGCPGVLPAPPPAAEWNTSQKRSWSLEQRTAFLISAVRHLTHLAHHPGEPQLPADVAHMVLLQTSLLMRASLE